MVTELQSQKLVQVGRLSQNLLEIFECQCLIRSPQAVEDERNVNADEQRLVKEETKRKEYTKSHPF